MLLGMINLGLKKGALFCLKGFIREPKPPQKGNKGTPGHPSSIITMGP